MGDRAGVVVTCRPSQRVLDEIAEFFVRATAFEDKDVRILGWTGPAEAIALIGRSTTARST